MTQRPFSRPGAIDLSALKRPAGAPAPGAAGAPGQPGGAAGAGDGGVVAPYALTVDEQGFQSVLESSRTAPVLLVFFSRTRMPESGQLADDLAELSTEFDGRFLLGLVDIDATPQIAQAMQIPSIPLVVAVLDGRPMPLFQDVLPLDELRAALTQVMQQLVAQGVTSRHQPRSAAPVVEGDDEPRLDPRFEAAEDAIAAGDAELAVAEYEKLVAANPADADLNAARAAAAAAPEDVEAQVLVADLDLLGGHVEDAFTRLIDVVRRTAGDERERARQHLVELFAVVGNADARVARGRQQLASALF